MKKLLQNNRSAAKHNKTNPIYQESVVAKHLKRTTSSDEKQPNKQIIKKVTEFECIGCACKFKNEKEIQIHLATKHNCNYVSITFPS